MHCKGMFWTCFADNIAAAVLRRELTWADPTVRWHSRTADRVGLRYAESEQERAEWAAAAAEFDARLDARVARARSIRRLGWGSGR